MYLDKGFNIKFTHRPKNKNLPSIAIGLDDFAGTGFFSREYVVSTFKYNNLKSTIGLGWGKFVGQNSFSNPLSSISEDFNVRPILSDYLDFGGKPSFDQWFRGEVSVFGGLEYTFPSLRGLKLKTEYDPFNYRDFSAFYKYNYSEELRKKESNINFGISYPINDFTTIDLSYIKGNTFNLNVTFGFTFDSNSSSKPKFNPSIKDNNITSSKKDFYNELLLNLNNNRLFLQTASLKENGELNVSISTSDHKNSIRSSSYAAFISQEVASNNEFDLSLINIKHLNAAFELNEISYVSSYLNKNDITPLEVKIRNTSFDSGSPQGYKNDEFKPIVKFPVIFSSFKPALRTHVGNPRKFYFGGLNLQNNSEIQFSRSLILTTSLDYPIYGNLEDAIYQPGSNLEHVRTDIVQYLREDDLHISRMQLDYFWSPRKNIYTKLSGGIFENMFGGFGGEFLYRPHDGNYSVGFEIFHVWQREFTQRFDFKDYDTITGHINFVYLLGLGIESKLSFGRYLAKDDGYTLDLGRRTKSGFKAGIYFTRTNLSAEEFGEGSFDKGFYFQIPFDLFTNEYSGQDISFKLSPLTRDGGAKLNFDKDLHGMIYNSKRRELERQWSGYLD